MLPLVLMSLAVAATASSNYTLPSNFNISAISLSERNSWCTAERNSCPEICGGVATSNSCDSSTLDFSCVCSNGSTADVAEYTQTIPFFVCEATYAQCIEESSTLDEQEQCQETRDNDCGTLNASATTTTSSTTTSATSLTTSTSSSSSSGSSGSTATTTSSSSSSSTTSNAAVRLAQEHATGLLATVLFVGLRLIL
ncbi:hypothetical protein AbraIFM66951_003300 [Aspergillus brasiliensis]|uniref:DUF7707 domain-containing protein n=1 Tax=Aspergillus brasiliensis TaxID=319629 RepID=A0A9W5YNY4_9EURO|nr:hypothetical protein AbraCBS73388_005350 [Aspergillus brasiliensis]GKZ38620.1 hypothetical protein AbraIFM66950_010954 [Aspergillus brasiliensis]GKZ50304.1 hypothetical protein AbraIFM66951_003300 [Aspergillus brasiliensis]